MRQLDQRVSIRYELQPLDREAVAQYVAHRLMIAGGTHAVGFTAKALQEVHRCSGGIPRLINLICDRALLAGFSIRANRITPEIVWHAAESLQLQPSGRPRWRWLKQRASFVTAAAIVLLAAATAVGVSAYLYEHFVVGSAQASSSRLIPSDQQGPPDEVPEVPGRWPPWAAAGAH